MIYGRSQQTLLPLWPELDSLVVSLGPFYTCAWCALERSTTACAPVAADPEVAHQLLLFLKSAGVISEKSADSAVNRSLYDPVGWTYSESWRRPANLESTLTQTLHAWRSNLDSQDLLWVWRQLSAHEARAYLCSQLRRHRIGTQLVDEVLNALGQDWSRLSLGRRRYVIWSSVRGAASKLLRSGGNEAAAIQVLSREVQSRARWLEQKESTGALSRTDYCFLPSSAWRRPLIVEVALETILRIGDTYWLDPPSSPACIAKEQRGILNASDHPGT